MRPTWDEYFLEVIGVVAKRATCDRGRSGCVIVRDNRVICTGYVGAPAGMPHCDAVGHEIKEVLNDDGSVSKHCVRTIHAEQNAILQAAKYGIRLEGAVMYCKMEPCRVCAMMIISVGITRVVAQKRYHAAQATREMFLEQDVELVVIEEEEEYYANK